MTVDTEPTVTTSTIARDRIAAASARVDRIADELGELADPVDRGDADPAAAFRLVADAGLLTLLLPTTDGGFGLDFAGYTQVLARIARVNGATALGFNMHNAAIASVFEIDETRLDKAGSRFRTWVVQEVRDHRRMFASATSEPGTGARLRGLATTYRHDGDQLVLDGVKSFVSLAPIADYYVVSAREVATRGTTPGDGPGSNEFEVSEVVLDRAAAGVEIDRWWPGAGLRGTATASVTLRGVVTPGSRLYLGVEGMSLFNVVRAPHWMAAGYLGAYLGIAEATVDFVADTLRHKGATAPAVLDEFGAMVIAYEATRSLVLRAAAAVSHRDPDANALIYAAKQHLGRTGQDLAATAVRLVGSAAMATAGPMQRLLREIQFCSIMPAKPHDCTNYVARARLGDNMLDVRSQSW
ncbi:acyl-CoA dehydrogenase family protein [Skermania piniformis]|uniref:Acyl-CoA/acyl-ACP dehydrogenase n=1 Tax=Skermania pinensis TaxID=39122 RepID=A0ABX8S8L1_9ACTN|nr:acyl-CoA dehydrogenase family protein [Skermania piniformis]QXQ13339.1 acyl-CoA/acyl-ACP dehydrogenase [Skermania piniformis]